MKKLISLTVILFSVSLLAQTKKIQTAKKQVAKTQQHSKQQLKPNPGIDYLIMKEGKVRMVKSDGKANVITSPVKMPNDAMVSPEGKVTLKDGKIAMMSDGDKVDKEGNLILLKAPERKVIPKELPEVQTNGISPVKK